MERKYHYSYRQKNFLPDYSDFAKPRRLPESLQHYLQTRCSQQSYRHVWLKKRKLTPFPHYIHIKYGIEPDRYQLQNEHAAGDKHEKSTKSLAEVATEARESSLVLSQDEDNHDDSGSDIGNSRPIDREYPIGH